MKYSIIPLTYILKLIITFVVICLVGRYVYGVSFPHYPAAIAFLCNVALGGVVTGIMTARNYKMDRRKDVYNKIVVSTCVFIPCTQFPKLYVIAISYMAYWLLVFLLDRRINTATDR